MRRPSLQHLATCLLLLPIAVGARCALASPEQQRHHENSSAMGKVGDELRALPDVVGFHAGVPVQNAYSQLKAYDRKAHVDVDSVPIPEISAKPIAYELTLSEFGADSSPEAVQVGITLPPNQQTVWRVARRLTAVPGKEMSRTNLIAALRKKYGPEQYMSGGANPILVWLFEQDGKRAIENRPPASPCALAPVVANTNGLGMAILKDPSPTFPQDQTGGWLRCKSLVYVRALLNVAPGRDAEYINSMDVSVGDMALATRAQDATAAFIANANARQNGQELDKLRQQAAPKL
jgi:hypothetical protein